MTNRTTVFAGQNKWAMIRLFWLEATAFLLIILLIFLPLIGHLIFWPCWITTGILLNISLPIYLKDKHQRAAKNKDFHDCIIRWGRFDKGEFLLGFINLVEIKPDWSDWRLKRFQRSRNFSIHLQRYLTKVLIEDFHAKRIGFQKVKKFVKQFKEGAIDSDLMNEVNKGVKVLKKQKKQAKNDVKIASKNINEYDLTDLPFSYLDLENDIKINKEKLKNCHLYIGLLYEQETREGHTIPFDRVAIITEQQKETVLKTEPMECVDKDDYDIDVPGVRCYYLCCRWALDQIPILYLRWSENMIEADIDALQSDDLDYLNIKVLEEIVFHKAEDSKQAGLKITKLETQKQVLEEELSDTVLDIFADGSWGFGNRLGDRQDVIKAQIKAKQWKSYAIVILVVAIFMIVFIVFFNLNLGNIPTPT